MAAKRSRLGRPSSSGDTTVLTAPIYESKEIRWPLNSPEPAIGTSILVGKPSPVKIRPLIFSLSAPVCDPVERVPFGAFLEKCCYCRKKIGINGEVFMSSMRAFCTAECREKQLDIDKDLKSLPSKPKLRSGKRAGFGFVQLSPAVFVLGSFDFDQHKLLCFSMSWKLLETRSIENAQL
ncbi:hypothetical protein Cgig2_033154 [Carnegiea gigantea]|uniref:FLZ-type domain-containing protein n=1 Tax=Carnegiea gigantea TaxID=171969 RepID=A0A9Q1GV01_9CARY|nr:hypothetical protein Cgig2_033154 [Carnegiea gigantea]